MKYYQELTVLASFEVPVDFIWQKVYQQLHIGFASIQDSDGVVPVGVSFPQYCYENNKQTVGEKLRVFAEQQEILEQLKLKKILQRLNDYVHVTGVREVPETNLQYAVYRRIHQESSPMQKARRFVKRNQDKGVTYEQAVEMFSKKEAICRLPYVKCKSLTNNQVFNLFIEKKKCEQVAYKGFNSYGLSDVSTVPEF